LPDRWGQEQQAHGRAAECQSGEAPDRVRHLDSPLDVSVLQPWTIVNVGPFRDDLFPAASRAFTATLYAPSPSLRDFVIRPWNLTLFCPALPLRLMLPALT